MTCAEAEVKKCHRAVLGMLLGAHEQHTRSVVGT